MPKVVKLVPLLREGADDLERTLLAAARNDGPPDAIAATRTLAALKAASRTAGVVGAGAAGWRWLLPLKPAALPWLAVGVIGVAGAIGGGAILLRSEKPGRELSSPRPVAAALASAPPPAGATQVVVPSARASAQVPLAPLAPSTRAVPDSLGGPVASAPRIITAAPRRPSERAARPVLPQPAASPQIDSPLASPAPTAAHPARGADATGSAPLAAPSEISSAPAGGLAGTAVAPVPSAPPPPAASSLRLEAALLESVRESLAASRVDRALASLDEYDARFPSGALEQEATVLRVEALRAAGRLEEARRLAADFERRNPTSSYVRLLRARMSTK